VRSPVPASTVERGGGLVVRRSAGRPACVPLPQDVSPLHEQCRGLPLGHGAPGARGTPARARGPRVDSPVDPRRRQVVCRAPPDDQPDAGHGDLNPPGLRTPPASASPATTRTRTPRRRGSLR
jgi:hypothetical protein